MMTARVMMSRTRRRVLTRQQQELVEQNIPLAYWFAKRVKAPLDLTVEEWESECLLSLVIAAESHDPSVGSYSNYVGVVVRSRRSHIINYHTRLKRVGRTIALGNLEPFVAGSDSVEAEVISKDDQRKCRELIARLPMPHREIMQRRLLDETLDSIGQSMGLTRERIRQLETEAKRRMLRAFRQDEERKRP